MMRRTSDDVPVQLPSVSDDTAPDIEVKSLKRPLIETNVNSRKISLPDCDDLAVPTKKRKSSNSSAKKIPVVILKEKVKDETEATKKDPEYNTDWEPCKFINGCNHPVTDQPVDWVQCDYCKKWFHIFCAFGRVDPFLGDLEFHCGCKKTKIPSIADIENKVKKSRNKSIR